MARSLPERTVDAYLSIAVTARFPNAALWDPTNTSGTWDHTVIAAGKTILFESKGNEHGRNDIHIDIVQLDDYLSGPIAPLVFYLFADPPGWNDARPPAAPGASATTWPTFSDWAYVMPAAALAAETGLQGATRTVRPVGQGQFGVPTTGAVLTPIPLGTFFDQLEQCHWVERHPRQGAPLRPGVPHTDYPDLLIGGRETLRDLPMRIAEDGADRSDRTALTAVVVHLPL